MALLPKENWQSSTDRTGGLLWRKHVTENTGAWKAKRKQGSFSICTGFFGLIVTTMLSRGSAFEVRLRLEFMIRVPGVRMALAVGDINSVWPLLCAADDDSVQDTCTFEAIWLLNVIGRLSVDPFLYETAAGVTWKRCGWWEGVKGKKRWKQSKRRGMVQMHRYGIKMWRSGHINIRRKEQMSVGAEEGGGSSSAALLALFPDSSLPCSSGDAPISHVSQQHE